MIWSYSKREFEKCLIHQIPANNYLVFELTHHMQHFEEVLKLIKLKPGDHMVSYYLENFYTNAPMGESLQLIGCCRSQRDKS